MPRHTKTDILFSPGPKPLEWLGSSLVDVRGFPRPVRQVAGFQLYRVQLGLQPNDWKPMPSIGQGVLEMRIHTGMEHRVIYVARFSEAVYVLHAFAKRTKKTQRRDLETSRRRLEQLVRVRRPG